MVVVSRETEAALERYEALFRNWNARINLAAPSTLLDFQRRHVADSLQLLDLAERGRRWVDLGSGGGLPGIPVGIALAEQRGAHIDLVESNRKKTAFLLTCIVECGASATVHPVRIEAAAARLPHADYVTARALAPLPELIALAEPWLTGGAIGLFHKGRGYRDELDLAKHRFRFDVTVHESVIDHESVILRIQNPVRV